MGGVTRGVGTRSTYEASDDAVALLRHDLRQVVAVRRKVYAQCPRLAIKPDDHRDRHVGSDRKRVDLVKGALPYF